MRRLGMQRMLPGTGGMRFQLDRFPAGRRVLFVFLYGIVLAAYGLAVAGGDGSDSDPAKASREDRFWSQVREMAWGPFRADFGGQFRLRAELDDGFSLKGYDPGGHDDLFLERLRLELILRLNAGPRLFLQLQDAHAAWTRYGDTDFPVSNPIHDVMDIRQLYGEWRRIGGSPVGFRVGRQQISYGDQRVFGPGNWGNTGRFAWDAAMLKVDTNWCESDTWAGSYLEYQPDIWPNRSRPGFRTLVNYTQLKRLPLRLDLFYVLKDDDRHSVAGETGPGGLHTHAVGVQAAGTALGWLDGAATYIRQFGRYGQDDVRAAGWNAQAGATLPLPWQPRLGGQFTLGTGDRDPADGIHGTFDGVYGGRDIFFYGYLNLFFWANLRDAEIDLKIQPHKRWQVFAELHRFSLDQARDAWYTTGLQPFRRDVSGQSGTALGVEFDARVVWSPTSRLEFMAGGGYFRPGRFIRDTGPAARAVGFFLQTQYSW